MADKTIVIYGKCSQCGHRLDSHKLDSLGEYRCPECPKEKCTRYGLSKADENKFPSMLDFGELTTIGIKPIGEMTERELIEEIMHAQYVALTSNKFSLETKRRMIAEIRVSSAKARIYREAGVSNNIWDQFGW